MNDPETLAALLESTGDYRVLRRFRPRARYCEPNGTATKRGLMLDVETTGLDAAQHEIIELAMVPFTYADDGRIFDVGPAFSAFNHWSDGSRGPKAWWEDVTMAETEAEAASVKLNAGVKPGLVLIEACSQFSARFAW